MYTMYIEIFTVFTILERCPPVCGWRIRRIVIRVLYIPIVKSLLNGGICLNMRSLQVRSRVPSEWGRSVQCFVCRKYHVSCTRQTLVTTLCKWSVSCLFALQIYSYLMCTLFPVVFQVS